MCCGSGFGGKGRLGLVGGAGGGWFLQLRQCLADLVLGGSSQAYERGARLAGFGGPGEGGRGRGRGPRPRSARSSGHLRGLGAGDDLRAGVGAADRDVRSADGQVVGGAIDARKAVGLCCCQVLVVGGHGLSPW